MMKQWDVVQRGRVVTRVSFDADMDADEVKRSLIDHDGFPSNIQVVNKSAAVRGAGGRALGQNGRRRIDQFEPSAFETRGVLAGAYRGRDVSERPLLTHTAWPDSDDAICGTIKAGALTDPYSDPKGLQLPPSCPRCLAKDPRFKAHAPNEDLAWREMYGREYKVAESRGLQPWQAREEAARIAWKDYAARTGKPALLRNPVVWDSDDEAEYMRLLDQHDAELEAAGALEDAGRVRKAADRRKAAEHAEAAAERIARRYAANSGAYYVWALARGSDAPLAEGPWGPYALAEAKTFARIGATEGAHDRAVSLGVEPASAGFRIVRRYSARTGMRLV